MTDEKLIDALRRMSPRLDMLDCENVLTAADRIEAQAAEIERLAKDKRWIIDERDRTFALMLGRVEKAEAEIERLNTQCEGLFHAAMNNGQALIIAEDKLEKAVKALEEIATDEHPLGWIAIAALAEIKGAKP